MKHSIARKAARIYVARAIDDLIKNKPFKSSNYEYNINIAIELKRLYNRMLGDFNNDVSDPDEILRILGAEYDIELAKKQARLF